jgi:hypothetical protein
VEALRRSHDLGVAGGELSLLGDEAAAQEEAPVRVLLRGGESSGAASADSSLAALPLNSRLTIVWETKGWAEKAILLDWSGQPQFGPQGAILALSGSPAAETDAWNAATGEPVWRISGRSGRHLDGPFEDCKHSRIRAFNGKEIAVDCRKAPRLMLIAPSAGSAVEAIRHGASVGGWAPDAIKRLEKRRDEETRALPEPQVEPKREFETEAELKARSAAGREFEIRGNTLTIVAEAQRIAPQCRD